MPPVVTEAEEADWESLTRLAKVLLPHSVSPARNLPQSFSLEDRIVTALKKLRTRARVDPAFIPLCLRDDEGEVAGYVFLELGDRNPILLARQALIVDIGIAEPLWGKFLWRPLMDTAFARAGRAGYAIVGGTVTVENRRSFAFSTRFLNFKPIGYQWARRIDPGERFTDSGNAKVIGEYAGGAMEKIFEASGKNQRRRLALFAHDLPVQWPEDLRMLARLGKMILLAVEGEGGLAYAVLDPKSVDATTGEREGCILDITLEEGAWDRNLCALLLRKAASLSAEAGAGYLVVHLPAGFDAHLERKGFHVERTHLTRFL